MYTNAHRKKNTNLHKHILRKRCHKTRQKLAKLSLNHTLVSVYVCLCHLFVVFCVCGCIILLFWVCFVYRFMMCLCMVMFDKKVEENFVSRKLYEVCYQLENEKLSYFKWVTEISKLRIQVYYCTTILTDFFSV